MINKQQTMKKILYIFILASFAIFTSCLDDLDQDPHVQDTSKDVYAKAGNYKQVLAKLYASFHTTGQEKGGGSPDLKSNNGQDYMRCYFNLQECGTDEVASTWLEGEKIANLSYLSWDANDPWVSDMYYRIFYNISLCNEFLRNSTEDKIAKFTAEEQVEIRHYVAEARFLRAFAYYHALDLYRNIPFVTEKDPVGTFIPPRYEAKQVFEFIESELTAIDSELLSREACEYGRAPKSAAYTLLAKLYLNAKVYIGDDRYADCITYCKKVIADGYSLETDYKKLFNADNNKRTNEIIFAFPVDAIHSVTWGTTTYIICGAVSNSSDYQMPENYGVTSGWGSFRVRGEIPKLFSNNDTRALFFTEGQSIDVNIFDNQSDGYFVTKWTNLDDAGLKSSNTADGGVNTDYPVYRLADVYLMLGEAVARSGAGSTTADALPYMNQIRQRAFGAAYAATGILTAADLTTDFYLSERARELYWECSRRTDLVRYDRFTTDTYKWQWKGGVKAGKAVNAKYNIYPIPTTDLTANPNLYNKDY